MKHLMENFIFWSMLTFEISFCTEDIQLTSFKFFIEKFPIQSQHEVSFHINSFKFKLHWHKVIEIINLQTGTNLNQPNPSISLKVFPYWYQKQFLMDAPLIHSHKK